MMSFLNLCSIFAIFTGLCLSGYTDTETKLNTIGFITYLCGIVLFLLTQ